MRFPAIVLAAGLSGLRGRFPFYGLSIVLAVLLHARAAAGVLTDFEPCSPRRVPAPLAGKAQCATLTVPEKRATPGSRSLELPVLRFPASDERPEAPIFVLNGGPGEANLDTILPLVEVGRRHDVYYVGYRGAEGTTVLQCPEVSAQLDVPEVFSSANLERLGAAGDACARRLQQSGIDFSHYTMLDVIDDLETARSALGHDKINLFSISYGTRVAQYYARRHPERIHRSVMAGANPPGHFVFSARVNDRVLDRLSQLCSVDPYCSARTDDLRSTVLKALHRPTSPAGARVDDGKSRLALFFAMYNRASFPAFADAAVAAEAGDWTSLDELGKAARDDLKQMVWGDLMSKGVVDTYRYGDMASTFATTAVSMGSPLDLLYEAIAREWPRTPFPDEYRRAAADPTQTLVINGDIDVATPLTFVEAELMPYLSSGRLLALKDYGHGDIPRQGPAFDHVIAEYFATGRVDASVLKEDPYSFRQ